MHSIVSVCCSVNDDLRTLPVEGMLTIHKAMGNCHANKDEFLQQVHYMQTWDCDVARRYNLNNALRFAECEKPDWKLSQEAYYYRRMRRASRMLRASNL